MIEGVPPRDGPAIDKSVDAEPKPCAKHAWCVRAVGHDGRCVIKPRRDIPPTNFGPRSKR